MSELASLRCDGQSFDEFLPMTIITKGGIERDPHPTICIHAQDVFEAEKLLRTKPIT